jgi:hypothetical protein
MSDGTIQDSRNPYSPQWGYLKVKNGDIKYFDDKDILSLFNDEPVVDVGYKSKKRWNQYVLFLHNIKKKKKGKTKRLLRGTKVKFEMVKARLKIEGKQRKKYSKLKLKKGMKIYVALVTEEN